MILTYHEVLTNSSYSYSVDCAVFAQHLLFLRGPQQARASARGEVGLPNGDNGGVRPFVRITFDDGTESQYLNAFPLLERYDVKATYFVSAGLVNSSPRFLTWSQLRELRRYGHSVQSHGWSHKFLTHCDGKELMRQLWSSREILEDKLDDVIDEISVPGGRWNESVLNACVRAGYKRVYVSEPWLRPTQKSGVELSGRFMVQRTTTMKRLRQIVECDGKALRILRLRSTMKRQLMAILGDNAYHWLWCRLAGDTQTLDDVKSRRSA
jgi:peptidoglycan/xylan/chitin deacetylase (PgdA/CDA1 family)